MKTSSAASSSIPRTARIALAVFALVLLALCYTALHLWSRVTTILDRQPKGAAEARKIRSFSYQAAKTSRMVKDALIGHPEQAPADNDDDSENTHNNNNNNNNEAHREKQRQAEAAMREKQKKHPVFFQTALGTGLDAWTSRLDIPDLEGYLLNAKRGRRKCPNNETNQPDWNSVDSDSLYQDVYGIFADEQQDQHDDQQHHLVNHHSLFPDGPARPRPYFHKCNPPKKNGGVVPPRCYTTRQRAVVDEFLHAWFAYVKDAFGHDELINGIGFDDWGSGINKNCAAGFGLTAIESLTTLWTMGLKREFGRVARYLESPRHTFHQNVSISFFEATIRMLGGLVSAYELSGVEIFLTKAHDLGERLMAAFDCKPDAILPCAQINLGTGVAHNPTWSTKGESSVALSEVASIQLEFKKLSYWTGKPRYEQVARNVEKAVLAYLHDEQRRKQRDPALWPFFLDMYTGKPVFNADITSTASLGANADSFYEYVVKQFVITSRREDWLKSAWRDIRRDIRDKLLVQVNNTHAFLAQYTLNMASDKNARILAMDHLVCFAPGMFLLGVEGDLSSAVAMYKQMVAENMVFLESFGNNNNNQNGGVNMADVLDVKLAHDLTRTCFQMYSNTETGLSPEIVHFTAPQRHEGLPWEVHDRVNNRAQDENERAALELAWQDLIKKDNNKKSQRRLTSPEDRAAAFAERMHQAPFRMFSTERDSFNIGRPEAIEAHFYLWRLAGRDAVWQDNGWAIFQAMVKYLRFKDGGYGGVSNVHSKTTTKLRRMESFMLAETFKYLFLLVDDSGMNNKKQKKGSASSASSIDGDEVDDIYPLSEWVFNTEAHPLRILKEPLGIE